MYMFAAVFALWMPKADELPTALMIGRFTAPGVNVKCAAVMPFSGRLRTTVRLPLAVDDDTTLIDDVSCAPGW